MYGRPGFTPAPRVRVRVGVTVMAGVGVNPTRDTTSFFFQVLTYLQTKSVMEEGTYEGDPQESVVVVLVVVVVESLSCGYRSRSPLPP